MPERAYFVNGNAPTLRTPLAADPEFGGGSLTLLESSQLRLQHSGSTSLANLILKGGELIYDGIGGGHAGLGSGGNDILQVESDSVIAFGEAGTLTLHSKLMGSAALTLAGDNESNTTLALAHPSHEFTGELRLRGGRLTATSPAALAGINITLEGGILDPSGELRSPNAVLVLASADSNVVFRHPMAFQAVKIISGEGNEISLEDGEYDSDALNELGLGVIFGEGEGTLIIGGPPPSLRITGVDDLGNGRIAIVWTSVPGVPYGIQSSQDLDSWEETESQQGADGPTTRYELERSKVKDFVRIVAKTAN